MASRDIESWLSGNAVDFINVAPEHREKILDSWNVAFSCETKRQTGNWIHEGFRWHSFSYGFHHAVDGATVVATYTAQWRAEFVVFDEAETWCVLCNCDIYPDLTPLKQDLYVAHHNMKWTMAFTHEQPDLGPYFAEQLRQA